MAELFGFSITRLKKTADPKQSFTQPQADDGTQTIAAGGYFGQYLDMEGQAKTEQDLIRRYREIALHPECDMAIEDWSVTVYNDTDFKLRNAFERWSNGINNLTDNEGLTNPADYQVDAFVDQLDRNGATIKSYTLRGAFPTIIAPIELTYDEATAIEEFSVTFAYQYFESNTTT